MLSNDITQETLFPVDKFIKKPEIKVIPFFIQKKYRSFLYKSFQNRTHVYVKHRVQTIYISPSSSFGKYLALLAVKSKVPVRIKGCNLFFSVNELGYQTGIYKKISGKYSLLEIPSELAKDLTNYIHDLFITTMISYVDGFLDSSGDITPGLISFMDKYELWDDWNKESLYRQYYRDKDMGFGNRIFLPKKM